MDPNLYEWLTLSVRWIHVIAAIMWIGPTLLFNRMHRNLVGGEVPGRPGSIGHVWTLHGGKLVQEVAFGNPPSIPPKIHWFKWESLATWVSGMLLLILVYYMGGAMVGPESPVGSGTAILIGIATLVGGVVLYRMIWSLIAPGRYAVAGGAVCYALIVLVTYGLCKVLTGRAAYMHVGAMFGTIMFTNVWLTILPSQRKMLAAMKVGAEPDPDLSARSGRCSRHNTFMMVPLVFIMISNHYPTVSYGSDYRWIVLAVLVLVGWGGAKIIQKYL